MVEDGDIIVISCGGRYDLRSAVPCKPAAISRIMRDFFSNSNQIENYFLAMGKLTESFTLFNFTYTIYSCYWQRKNSKTQMFPVNGEIIYLQILAYFHSSQRTSSMTQDRVCKIIGLNFLKIDEKVRLIYNHCVNQVQTCFQFPYPWLTTPRCHWQEGLVELSSNFQ